MDSSRYCRIELVNRTDFSEDLAVFYFRASEAVDFTPGQYATIGLEDEDTNRPLLRPYSVASAPHENIFEFFVELVEDGALTPRLWTAAQGATFWMRKKITGRFVLDDRRRTHVMASTVTGVAPYVSIVRDQIRALKQGALDEPHRFLIVHGASRSWELGTYFDELTAAAERFDWLRYVPTISRPWEDPDWTGEVGRVDDVLRKHIDAAGIDPPAAAAYACGHPQMIDNAQGILKRARFEDDFIHEEKYFIERTPRPKTSTNTSKQTKKEPTLPPSS